ncbi:UDP-glucose/iron transport system permease protein, partial [Tremellales sp. Uapishka_1]
MEPSLASLVASSSPTLTWVNVLIGFLFIVFDAVLSLVLGLGIGGSLIVAALRCILQLSVMGLILDSVFASDNIFGVFGIASGSLLNESWHTGADRERVLLNILGAVEATYNKSKRRFTNMFPFILLSMMSATIPISIIGTRFAMSQIPFWQPDQYVPIIGMILGNAISAIGVGMNSVQKEFAENRDKVETYLAMGATRFEATKPLAVEALKLALLPTINQLSVIGLISIPGMMTGAIVGGKSVEQAARLQMIIMFMISASSALSVLIALLFALTTLVDSNHRIRLDKLDSRKPAFYRWRDGLAEKVWNKLKGLKCWGREKGTEEERRGLLNGDGDGH